MVAPTAGITMNHMTALAAVSPTKGNVGCFASSGFAIEHFCEGIVSSHYRPETAAGVFNELVSINCLCRVRSESFIRERL